MWFQCKNERGYMLENVKACIFDLDGTLIDSMGLWEGVDEEYFAMHNVPLPADYQKMIDGLSIVEIAVMTKEKFGFKETVEEMLDHWNKMAYYKYAHEIQAKPGAYEFLQKCKEKGIKIGVATSNSIPLYSAVAKNLKFDEMMEAVVTGEDVKNGKPDPESYLKVAGKLGVDPKDCLVFEDLVVGIQSGIAAGMKTCAIYDKFSENQDEERRKLADYYFKDFWEVIKSEKEYL